MDLLHGFRIHFLKSCVGQLGIHQKERNGLGVLKQLVIDQVGSQSAKSTKLVYFNYSEAYDQDRQILWPLRSFRRDLYLIFQSFKIPGD